MKNDFISKRDYIKWMGVKADVNNSARFRTFSEGQIWWCAVGENVGVEINGKGDYFLRPVYIFKKNGKLSFMGVPLTTKAHEGYGYVKFLFKKKETFAIISQARTISSFRLVRKMGEADGIDVEKIKKSFSEYFGLIKNSSSIATGVGRENPEI